MPWIALLSIGARWRPKFRWRSGSRPSSIPYVSAAHRDDPGRGCAVPTLGAEIARESAKTRKAFAAKLDQMIDLVADQIPDVPRKTARRLAMGTMATMMGALVMSRVAGSGELSDEILASGREAALARAEAKPVAKRAKAKVN